jgi:hypothetical protein
MNDAKINPAWAQKSPWLDLNKPNLFRDEFRLAEQKTTWRLFHPA